MSTNTEDCGSRTHIHNWDCFKPDAASIDFLTGLS